MDQRQTIRAENNAKFYSRFKWLALGALAFGVWSVYDGVVTYPDQQKRAYAMLELAEEHLSQSELAEAQEGAHGQNDIYKKVVSMMRENEDGWEAWKAEAAENEWDEAPPTKARSDGDIAGQYVMAVLCALATAYFLGVLIRTTGRWMEIDGETVRTSGGLSFDASTVTEIDKRQWVDKGIARLKYDDNGRTRKFVIDNYKYIREETDEILYRVEQVAGADKIVNGTPEADLDAPDKPADPISGTPEPASST